MKNFNFRITLSIILLSATAFIASVYVQTDNFRMLGLFVVLFIYQIYLLIKYINHTNRQLTDFIRGINYSDFTQNIKIGRLGGNFAELSIEMEKLISRIKDARFEKEEYLRYLQTVVEHVGIGLISFNSKGDVELLNKWAKKTLQLSHLQNILSLDTIHSGLGTLIFQLNPEQKGVYKLYIGAEEIQLMVQGTEFRMKNEQYKLVSFYNIHKELEEKEIEAWQKLTRVLTHEIMNSITPISSLASIAAGLFNNKKDDTGSADADISEALNTIQKRSEGLISFVNKFKDISRIYKPNLQPVKVDELFYNVRLLTSQSLSAGNIQFNVSIEPEGMEIIADPNLITQVLINLINNASQALINTNDGKITLTANINEKGKAIIKITDNGPGINEAITEKIFIPFFTTKPDGSGIGLSISQSIIRAHGGNIRAESDEKNGTVFTISL